MRSRRQLFFALLANIFLVAYFTHERFQILVQLKSVSEGVNALTQSNKNLEEELRHSFEIKTQVEENLKANYLRLKELTEYTKSYHIRVKGVPEKDGESLEEKVTELAEYMGIKVTPADINRVNRVGISRKSTPRVIVVEFTTLKLKARILRQAAISLIRTPFAMQDDVTNHVMPEAFSPVEAQDFQDGCGFISAVSKPTTRAQAKKLFGAWLQDPVPSPDGISDTYVWVMPHFYESNVVEEYANIHELSHRRSRKTYELPYEWAGTGHVVYNRTLYFVVFNSTKIVRYDFGKKAVLAERKLQGALCGNNAPYQWSGSTDIDLSTDVYGLWAIYATYENTLDIVLSRIDPTSLNVIQTWKTNWRKQWSGNAFMMCGVLYVLRKYDERNTALSYAYDTRTKRYRRTEIPFSNEYEWNTMLEYNFRLKQVYAWDRGYLVTYNVTLSAEPPV